VPLQLGPRWRRALPLDRKWSVVNLAALNPADLRLALAFCERRAGMQCDWAGILGFVLPWGGHDDQDRFCSEAAVEVLHAAPVALRLPQRIGQAVAPLVRWRTKPARLYRAGESAAR